MDLPRQIPEKAYRMLKTLKNEQGLILVIVFMIVIVMTTLTLSLISLNISQAGLAEQEVKRIQAELIGSGMLTLMVTRQQSAIIGTSMQNTFNMGTNYLSFQSNVIMTPSNSPFIIGTMNSTVTYNVTN